MEQILDAGIKLISQEPMSKHTTLGIGGPADWYAEASSVSQLATLMNHSRDRKLPVFFLGAGSNLLVSDAGIEGLVIRLKGDFENFEFSGNSVRAGAGVFLPTLVKQCAEKGLGGAEPLVGVPGTVGGAVIMNAGTPELWIGHIVQSVETLEADGTLKVWPAEIIDFQYRHSSLAGHLVCFATLNLKAGKKEDFQKIIQDFLSRRLKTQPIGTLNVGSIFKNPPGNYAAQLIEKAGLKGLKRGGAQISPKHANFIVNTGGAKASEIQSLIEEIQGTVREKFGVELEPEVKRVGKGS